MRAGWLAMTAALLGAAGCGDDAGPVAVAWEKGAEGRLLQVVEPGGSASTLDISGGMPVIDVVISPRGTAVAFATRTPARVFVYRGGTTRELERPPSLLTLSAITDDGAVVVAAGSHGILVLRDDVYRDVSTERLGKLWYRIALSADGERVVFSTLDAGCGYDVNKMGTCAVSLWQADISEQGSFAAGPSLAAARTAYDPELLDAHGDRMLYMSDADDRSPECVKHVNGCKYAVHELDTTTGVDRVVATDGWLARRAPDGWLVFHRGPPGRDGDLVVHRPDGGERELGPVDGAYHHWSPDGRWIVVRRRGEAVVIDRDGKRRAGIVPTDEKNAMQPIGWLTAADARRIAGAGRAAARQADRPRAGKRRR